MLEDSNFLFFLLTEFNKNDNEEIERHCVKSLRILRISQHSSRMPENAGEKNSEYKHFSRSQNSLRYVLNYSDREEGPAESS